LRGQLTESGLYMGMSFTILFIVLDSKVVQGQVCGYCQLSICHTMRLKPISQTRTGSYIPATDASPCQGSHVTKTGMNIIVESLDFITILTGNIDHVLRIPSREVMHISILISSLIAWYVPLFSFNSYSIHKPHPKVFCKHWTIVVHLP
jgi:hypothetical protein